MNLSFFRFSRRVRPDHSGSGDAGWGEVLAPFPPFPVPYTRRRGGGATVPRGGHPNDPVAGRRGAVRCRPVRLAGRLLASLGTAVSVHAPLPNEDETAQALCNANLESGTYLIPFPVPEAVSGADQQRQAAYHSRRVRGPIVEVIYRREGVDASMRSGTSLGFASSWRRRCWPACCWSWRCPACRAIRCACCSSPWSASSRPWRSTSRGRSGSITPGRRCCTRRDSRRPAGWRPGW